MRLPGVTAVLDIGSNSVRCGVFIKGRAEKTLITSRLGEGVESGNLSEAAMSRTVAAVSELKNHAFNRGAEFVFAFATEAVRRAANGGDFLCEIFAKTGIDVFLASGETEAQFAVSGALGLNDGAVIDLGGASTEIAVQKGGKLAYIRSVPVGAVVLKDVCGRDKNKLAAYIAKETAKYGEVPRAGEVYAVGGTATSLAAAVSGLKKYDPAAVHGARVGLEQLDAFSDSVEGLKPCEISERFPVDLKRAEIIFGGALLLKEVVKRAGSDHFTASESDNLEGFYNLLECGKIRAVPCARSGGGL